MVAQSLIVVHVYFVLIETSYARDTILPPTRKVREAGFPKERIVMARFFTLGQAWLRPTALLVGVIVVGVVAHRLMFSIATRIVQCRPHSTLFSVLGYLKNSAFFILLLLSILPSLRYSRLALVHALGLIIYFNLAKIVLHGTLL